MLPIKLQPVSGPRAPISVKLSRICGAPVPLSHAPQPGKRPAAVRSQLSRARLPAARPAAWALMMSARSRPRSTDLRRPVAASPRRPVAARYHLNLMVMSRLVIVVKTRAFWGGRGPTLSNGVNSRARRGPGAPTCQMHVKSRAGPGPYPQIMSTCHRKRVAWRVTSDDPHPWSSRHRVLFS